MAIHPTAIVDRRAEIDATAEIGPYVIVDGPVRVGARTRVLAHACLVGDTEVGADTVIYPGASVGQPPQDLGWDDGTPSGVRIGDRTTLREQSEVHRASRPEAHTVIGSDVYLMSRAHVGHDSRVADHAILASGALVAGHCEIGERAFVSGNCVVHQYVRVGRLAILRGLSRTSRDVPPFAIMDDTHVVRGLNRVGLRRAGFDAARIRALSTAYRILFRVRRNLAEAVREVEARLGDAADVRELLDFIGGARRGVAMGPARGTSCMVDDPPVRSGASS